MISRSSRSSISCTLGDDVPLLRVLGAAALTRSRCHSRARKVRHAAAEFTAGVDKVVHKALVVFFNGVDSLVQTTSVEVDLGQRLQHFGHPLAIAPLGVECQCFQCGSAPCGPLPQCRPWIGADPRGSSLLMFLS